MEDVEVQGFDDPDKNEGSEEDEDDILGLIPPEDDRDPDELANIVRPEMISKTFKVLSADAQRAGGVLSRDDANRTYLRRELSIAERIEVEGKLAAAGYRISEDEGDDDDAKDGSVTTNRRKLRYLSHNEERELGRRIQLAQNLPTDTTGCPPGAASNSVTYGYNTAGKVSSVAVAGSGTWSYAYPSATQTTVTDPSSQVRSISYTSVGLVTSSTAGGRTTSFAYCGAGETNCPQNLLKQVTLPEGNKVAYAYDARGNVTTTTHIAKAGSSLANIVTSAAYPANCPAGSQKTCNKPVSTTDARGKVTNYTYDAAHGGVTSIKLPADANGVRPETRISYTNRQAYYKNSAGSIVASGMNIALPTQVASCRTAASCAGGTGERKTVISYGPQTAGVANNLNPVSATLSRGDGALAATTTTAYDNYGRVLTVDGPLSGAADTARVRYNLAGQVIGEVRPDPDGTGASKFLATRYTYNARGQVYLTETGTVNGLTDADWGAFTPTGNTITQFDTHGRAIRQNVRNGTTVYQVTDTLYDTMGRVQCTMQRMNSANWSTLPTNCNPTQTTGPNGPDRVTYNHYDALGRVWKVTTGYGTSAAADEQVATFTNNGQLATLTDAEANRTTYEYDGHDRLVKTRFPHPTTKNTSSTTDYEQVGYDAAGNVTSFRTRRGETLTLGYDNLNRLISKVVPERSGLAATHTRDVYFGYDLFGNMTYARFDSVSGQGITNAYDALGQLASTTTNLDGVSWALSYQYDVAGNLTRITHPDGNYFNYNRHPSGAFYYASTTGTGPNLFHPVLDAAGRTYRLHRWDTTAGSWSNQYSQFGYDPVSRLASLATVLPGTSHDTTTSFTYNPASQIASQTRTNDTYAWTGHVAVNRNYTANGLNQYSAITGLSGISYDANGNLTSDGSNSYVYDVENRLVTRSGGASATLRYDPLGRLHEITGPGGTRRFLYDGSDLVAEYNSSGALLRRYVHGTSAGDDPMVWFEGSGIAHSARRYLYADERGSIVAVTNSTGGVLAVNKYDEYGIPAAGNAGAFQYTGQVWLPELGMYYYKARIYSPTLGRFMQTDPIGYGDGMNMYAYVGGDPINGVDPTGMCDEAKAREHASKSHFDAPPSPCIVVLGSAYSPHGQAGHYNHIYGLMHGLDYAASIFYPTAQAPPGAFEFLPQQAHKAEPQSPDPETVERNQCRLAAVASGFGNASLSATGLIPGGRAAAVVVRTGATSIQATSAILGRDGTGGTITAVGFATELGNAALGNRGGQVTLGSAAKAVAQNLPGLGTLIAITSIGNDAYNAYQAYQACSAD